VVDTPSEAAVELKVAMLEVLRQMNRSEMEGADVVGLELEELRFELSRGRLARITVEEVGRAVSVLVANGYARELTDTEYAWTRGRTVSDRFTITPDGKAFLLREIERTGRID
jgi:hypothetical protein